MHDVINEFKHWALHRFGLILSNELIDQRFQELAQTLALDEDKLLFSLQTNQPKAVKAAVEQFTVQESYFFRDSMLFLYLKNTLLPNLILEKRKKNDRQLTIWSVGCSRGEEIYSIAIYLRQLIPSIEQWSLHLVGCDIHESSLEKARQGLFTQSSLRATDHDILNEYFETNQKSFILKPIIRDMVTFEHCNIAELPQKNHYPCDLIFCRNVFIYLNQATIERALQCFYASLVDDGILFVGPADLLSYYQNQFSFEIINDVFFYKKALPKEKLSVYEPNKIASASSVPYVQKLQDRAHQLAKIRILLDHKKYKDVLEKVNLYLESHEETSLLHRYQGEALIGLGDTDTAIIYLDKSIKLDPTDPISHFLQGLAQLDMKNVDKAISFFKKAIYIKNNFPEATYYLGLLYLQNNQKQEGIKLLKQSLQYAKEQPENKRVLYANGTMEHLMQDIMNKLDGLTGKTNE